MQADAPACSEDTRMASPVSATRWQKEGKWQTWRRYATALSKWQPNCKRWRRRQKRGKQMDLTGASACTLGVSSEGSEDGCMVRRYGVAGCIVTGSKLKDAEEFWPKCCPGYWRSYTLTESGGGGGT